VLASASPRRGDIFRKLGVAHTVLPVDVDEKNASGKSPELKAMDAARMKAVAAAELRQDAVIITADTIVVLGDGRILGKPDDEAGAFDMLSMLEGETHTVITGLAVTHPEKGSLMTAFDRSSVTFCPMSEKEIEWYISTGEPMDKAGAYGLQEKGMLFVQSVSGSHSNVIGLPIQLLYHLLLKVGVSIFDYIEHG